MRRCRHILISIHDGDGFRLHGLRLSADLLIQKADQLLLLQDQLLNEFTADILILWITGDASTIQACHYILLLFVLWHRGGLRLLMILLDTRWLQASVWLHLRLSRLIDLCGILRRLHHLLLMADLLLREVRLLLFHRID